MPNFQSEDTQVGKSFISASYQLCKNLTEYTPEEFLRNN